MAGFDVVANPYDDNYDVSEQLWCSQSRWKPHYYAKSANPSSRNFLWRQATAEGNSSNISSRIPMSSILDAIHRPSTCASDLSTDRRPASMLASKDMGCLICSQLFEERCMSVLDRYNSTYSFRLGSLFEVTPFGRLLIPNLELQIHLGGHVLAAVLIHQIEGSGVLTELAVEASKASSTGDTSVGRLAKYWMAECLEKHQCCAPSKSTTWYPDRLLALDETTVRLRQGPTKVGSGQYATISHCWGGFLERPCAQQDVVLVLDDKSEEALMHGIPRCNLPQTVQDVIATVLSLGINFLWMDCYCIRQRGPDSVEDKPVQIAAMADIYANAIINISASSARDPFDGCFHPRDSSNAHRCVRWRPTSLHDEGYFHVANKQPPEEYEFFRSMPLMNRGWVLQERVLSKRILHLCVDQILWECKHLQMACETHPYGVRNIDGSSLFRWGMHSFMIEDFKNGDSHQELLDMAHWGNLVSVYTRMSLSWPNDDKLAAISGVARRVATVLDDNYVAGLWRKTLLYDLCWLARPHGGRSNKWRAPT